MSFHLTSASSVLNTDFYQITMAAGYHLHRPEMVTCFELSLRRLPAHRHFLVTAGLHDALHYLETLHLDSQAVDFLKKHPALHHLPTHFFEALEHFKFTGNVDAIPEGTVCFEHTPLLRVTAPAMQAQWVETFLLALINYQTNVASKAARIHNVLQGYRSGVTGKAPTFIDFGSRRAQGPEAALHAARAAYLGGAIATSNVAVGYQLGIPVTGTAAHAWTMAFESEKEAFEKYHHTYPEHTVLLVDTYDTLQGVRHAIEVAGHDLKGIRLDSGDFLSLSKAARQLLDQAGLHHTQIIVSGDMNEERIQKLLAAGAPIDSFGVGTELTTCRDTPSLGGVYKLVEQVASPGQTPEYAIKSSANKISYPGQKQVWRYAHKGVFQQDLVTLTGETPPPAEMCEQPHDSITPLLVPVMRQGQRCAPSPSLATMQAHVLSQLNQLPAELRTLEPIQAYPVMIHPGLKDLYQSLEARNAQ